MTKIMFTCIILHTIIIEDEKDMDKDRYYEYGCQKHFDKTFFKPKNITAFTWTYNFRTEMQHCTINTKRIL